MAVCEVVQFGDPVLRKICTKIREGSLDSRIMEDLRDTLEHLQRVEGIGRALAAPQIGYSVRAVYINSSTWKGFMLNPEIVRRSEETFEVMDGCFSATLSFFGPVKRHRLVEVRYQDAAMKVRQMTFIDSMSELIQHELDHLDGILFIDRLTNPSLIVTRREWEKRYRWKDR